VRHGLATAGADIAVHHGLWTATPRRMHATKVIIDTFLAPTAADASAHAGAPGVTSQVDDRLYAWEAMSLLLASDDLPAEDQANALRRLLSFLCAQISTNLEGDVSSFAVMASSPTAPSLMPTGRLPSTQHGVPTETMLLNHALEAVARLSKGFSHERMTKRRPQVGAP
jgi:hypothetical protein